MDDDSSVTFADVEHHLPPESPQDYVSHDRYLRERLGDGALNSIKKEMEGMVRLYDNVENELDEDTRQILLEQLIEEIDKLDRFEDDVALFMSKTAKSSE
ncbi:hypothetical protein [Halobaculum rarum]|uniref:hypothetical protein n=1 Tax=Halobaculum rarum TaxID=3075122 RepID=UPI0032AEB04E